ncbi:phenoloxidase-activating factor 2-like [Maniola jurtina]|uniref:phenoloxidase-activating factor 2-like n=1 Tax=Maniola jurtina TaxID=191418 RepID=UPI001E68E8D5|nr:phenoloxidase-activating factor 2-like [Maniola jurtina]
MRLQALALALVVLACSSARSQKPLDSDEEKAIEWLTQLYKKDVGVGVGKTTAQPINNRFNDKDDVFLSPRPKKNNKAKSCYTDAQEMGMCAKASNCNKEPVKLDSTSNFILREGNPCHFLETCCPLNQLLAKAKKPEAIKEVSCGYSNPGASVFREKLGSSKSGYADYGEFPWMVALLKTGAAGWVDENYLGGGTIIHPSVVMTVAHKVDTLKPEELKCRAGEWDTQTENEAYGHQERNVDKIIVHDEFFRIHVHNNIALLTLKKPFINEPHVGVACLSLALPPPGTVCYSMGWGEDFTKSDKYANLLKKITLPLVSSDDCQTRYRNTRLGSRYTLHRSLTCAGGEAMVDTCIGDGGSSLVCPVGNPGDLRYAVVGMVAYGLECGAENIPGVYVKVPELYDWVGAQMAREGFNRSSYDVGTEAQFKLRS